MSTERKMLVALDPFTTEKSGAADEAAMTLGNFARQRGMKLQAVTAAHPGDLEWPRHLPPQMRGDFESLVAQRMRMTLDRLHLETELPPHVLYQPVASRRTAARAVADFARTGGAELIAVVTGLKPKPWLSFPGGFTEALLGVATVPVLSVSAVAPVRREFRRVLMPVDLTPEGDAAAERGIAFAKDLGARLVIFHVLADSPSALAVSGAALGGDIATVNALFEEDRRFRTQLANNWSERARAAGVENDVVLWPGHGVAQAVLETARQVDADLILMAAKAGPLEAALIGSSTRDVMAAAKAPVLVLRAV